MVFKWAVSETCFQETGFSGSDFKKATSKRDSKNRIPMTGFLMPVGRDRFYHF